MHFDSMDERYFYLDKHLHYFPWRFDLNTLKHSWKITDILFWQSGSTEKSFDLDQYSPPTPPNSFSLILLSVSETWQTRPLENLDAHSVFGLVPYLLQNSLKTVTFNALSRSWDNTYTHFSNLDAQSVSWFNSKSHEHFNLVPLAVSEKS